MGMKCQRCNYKKKTLYHWYGLKLCNPCITEILQLMRERGALLNLDLRAK